MTRKYRQSLSEKFADNHVPEPNTGCWLWTGSLNTGGYGHVSHKRRMVVAHRLALLLLRDEVPAEGMVVDHICRVRSCVNPDHLRVVTQRENVLENSESRPAKQVRNTHCPQGHPYSGDNLAKWSRHRVCLTCKRAYDRRREERKRTERAPR